VCIIIIVVVVYILVAAVRNNRLIAKATPSEVETTVKLLWCWTTCSAGSIASNHDGTDTDISD